MEDPWGSPWDADAPATIPAIIKKDTKQDTDGLPGFGDSNGFSDSPWNATNGVAGQPSDIDAGDEWGAWNDGPGTSWEETKPVATNGFDEPWDTPDYDAKFTTLNKNVDSAVSFGDSASHKAPDSPVPTAATDVLAVEQRAWEAAVEEPSEKQDTVLHKFGHDRAAASRESSDSHETVDDTGVERKGSKVQGLVELYDGMARKASTPDVPQRDEALSEKIETPAAPPIPATNEAIVHTETPEPIQASSQPDSADEEEQSESDDQTTETSEPTRTSFEEDSPNKEVAVDDAEQRPPSPTPKPPKSQPIPYPIDLTNLDKLFPNTSAISSHPEPISDTIITNNFTEITQRKAWYRISRFGSTRKHDNGDDDTYVRTTWANSTVRHDTLKIVRRWMEQDSIAGRVILGRKPGPLGASMFGWDSSEPQVEIGELLKTRARHVRNRSLPAAETPMTPVTGSFGWNSTATVPSTPSAVVQSPRFAAQMGSLAAAVAPKAESPALPPSPWEDEAKSVDENVGLGLQSESAPDAPATVENNDAGNGEDEDDWGEMISSPPPDSSSFPAAQLPAQFNIAPTTFDGLTPQPASAHPSPALEPPPTITTPKEAKFVGLGLTEMLQGEPITKTVPLPLQLDVLQSTEDQFATFKEADDLNTPSPAPDHVSADIIAEALRGLPDLSYMLR